MTQIKKVLALVDGSLYSQTVCDHAAWLAHGSGAAVEILHVLAQHGTRSRSSNLSGSIGIGARTALMEELVELDAQEAKLAHKMGRAILEDAKIRVAENGIEAITTRLRHGSLVDMIDEIDEADQDIDCIVLGKRGVDAERDMHHLGSNLERVLRAIHKPSLVAAKAFHPIQRVLIAFDGGDSVLKAVDYLAGSPVFKDAECELLAVGSDASKGAQRIQHAATTLSAKGLSVTVETESGQPEEVISRRVEAGGFDLLVMGAYGHSQIRSLIIGSTTTAMIQSCKIPLLLFR